MLTSSSIFNHAFGPKGRGFAVGAAPAPGITPSTPDVASLSCATMTLPTSSEPFGTCTMALSCSVSVPVRLIGRDWDAESLDGPRDCGRGGGGGMAATALPMSVKSTLLVLRR